MTLPNPAWAMIGALIIVSLAGCLSLDEFASHEDQNGMGSPDATGETPTSSNDPAPGNGRSFDPPVAKLQIANQEGTATGQAPFTVQFNLTADYPDMSRLHWVFDTGDGTTATNGTGDGLPLRLNHTYTEPGNHTATFTVEDDTTNHTVTRKIQVETAETTTPVVTLIVHTQHAGLAGQTPGSPDDLPGTARCELEVASGADGGDVLDEGVAADCIAEWSHDEFDGARYVVSIDNLRAEGLTCLAWPVVCQFWEFRINDEPSEVGIDDYRAEDGDRVEFFHRSTGE